MLKSGAYGEELGLAPTWRMYSWHSAWCCQSHRLLPESPPPQAPSSKSYTLVLWEGKKGKLKYEAESYCAALWMYVKGENSSSLSQKINYTMRLQKQETDDISQWYFMHFRMTKVWYFTEKKVKNLAWILTVTISCLYERFYKHLQAEQTFCVYVLLLLFHLLLQHYCWGIELLPGWMLSLIMLTCSSRSGRVCSCQNPITWPNSCTTMPNLSQFFPMDIAWGPPPRRPT